MGAFIVISVIIGLFAIGHCFSNITDARFSKGSLIHAEEEQKKNQYDKLIAECRQKEEQLNKSQAQLDLMIQNTSVNLNFNPNNSKHSPLIPPHLLSSYMILLRTERLDKATSGEFSFKYPISVSATTLSTDNYETTLESCTCDAYQKGHAAVCKHMLALALQVHAFNSEKDIIEALLNSLIEQNKKNAELLKEKTKRNDEYKKLQKALNDRYQSHPYLADMVAEYKVAKIEAHIKDPYTKQELMAKIRRAEKEKTMLKNRIAVHESVYPLLKEYKNLPPKDLAQAILNTNNTEPQDQ